MEKMWAGRTDGVVNSIADDFNSSIRFDSRMYRQDIQGSMAHAEMLAECGIISEQDAGGLIVGLRGILEDLEDGSLSINPECEDIHMFVEQILTERIGELGKSFTPPARATIRLRLTRGCIFAVRWTKLLPC